ncbi:hypothetical protein KY332_04430 [Candidatus Woesearchaeota archaeon]|nr:hypothetical protein [Candidatus Woesearchaeota archaeon]
MKIKETPFKKENEENLINLLDDLLEHKQYGAMGSALETVKETFTQYPEYKNRLERAINTEDALLVNKRIGKALQRIYSREQRWICANWH